MAPRLYKYDMSSPTRAVYLTAKCLGIELEFVEVDLFAGDNYKPEFLKLNPQHTVPTLVDEGNVLWDSHAINVYLVSKYGEDDSLYPTDYHKRAVVDQRLHFDSGVMFPLIKESTMSAGRNQLENVSDDMLDQIFRAYAFLEAFLEGHKWTTGDSVTLADFSLLSSASALGVMVPIDPKKYPNVTAWMERGQQLPYYYVTEKGLNDFKVYWKTIVSQAKVSH